ncbi:BspA family leucine-rich repeat surface protein [Succinatimonas hippei]|uniref:BspA family leucine-rich repeat surface protein n=1 Tax=Succinatimonas hippei TaxID=626938 RepID=UPI003D17662F
MGDIDTVLITDMSELFHFSSRSDFSGIEKWDVSNVRDMNKMFFKVVKFNADLSQWNVSNVTDMSSMFEDASLMQSHLPSWYKN